MKDRPARASALFALMAIWSLTSGSIMSALPEPQDQQHDHASAPAHPVQQARLRLAIPPPVGDITLVDSNDRPIGLQAAVTADVPVLLNFIFTSCTTICPVMSAGFARLEAKLRSEGRAVRLVSISIDPEVDTPARLREYAARVGAGGYWWFLTGSRSAVVTAQRAFGAYRGSKENHAPATYLRRSADAPWEQLDGLQSLDALLRAYDGL